MPEKSSLPKFKKIINEKFWKFWPLKFWLQISVWLFDFIFNFYLDADSVFLKNSWKLRKKIKIEKFQKWR